MSSATSTPKEILPEVQPAEFLVVTLAGQKFGIPVENIRHVVKGQNITPIPLAPDEIIGVINLRGRIVTALDIRQRLDIEPKEPEKETGVIIEHENELYSLSIDSVKDVLRTSNETFEAVPPTLAPAWQEISSGIYHLENELLIILDIPKFLETLRF